MNTYYCFEGTGDEVQQYWEKMTRIRLQYLPDPGPVGTAVRVAGLMYDGFLIEVDVMAVLPEPVVGPGGDL
jgi:enamine deaminase RidA (YjgF/YER057c/UK114 family)